MRTLSTQDISAVSGGTFCHTVTVCKPSVDLSIFSALLNCLKLNLSSCEPAPKPVCQPKPVCEPKPTCGGSGTGTGGTTGPVYQG